MPETTDVAGLIARLRSFPAFYRSEIDDAVKMLRVIGEELVIAGYPGGDRTVTLANVRLLVQREKVASAAVAEQQREIERLTGQNERLIASEMKMAMMQSETYLRMEKAEAAAAAPPREPMMPEIPREPTQKMLNAAATAMRIYGPLASKVWTMMYDAAIAEPPRG